MYHYITVLTNWITNLHNFLNTKFQFGNLNRKFCPRLLKKNALLGSGIIFALN